MKYNTKRRKIAKRKWFALGIVTTIGFIGVLTAYIGAITPIMAQSYDLDLKTLKSPKQEELTIKEHVWNLLTEEGGLSFDEAMIGMAIVNCESNWNIYAIGPTNDYGLWQISENHHDIGRAEMFDVYASTRYAIELYKSWGSWDAWVCNNII